MSAAIQLEEGEAYYIEALMKESGGGDHVSVSWRRTDQPPPKNGDPPIAADHLAYRDE